MWSATTENRPVIRANGEEFFFEPGQSFRAAVNQVARQVGYGKFTVTLNGTVIDSPEDAPPTLVAGDVVILAPYNVPG
ncbi:MAG: hypothetical protein QXQ53_05665 [Candidatus Methanosuratincola sp.]